MTLSLSLVRSVVAFCVLAVVAVALTLLLFPEEGEGQIPAVAALVVVGALAVARLATVAGRGDAGTWRPTAPLVPLPGWLPRRQGRPADTVPDAVSDWEAMLIAAETGPARSRSRLSARLRDSLDLDLDAHLDDTPEAGPPRAALLDAVDAALDHQEAIRERP